MVLSVIGIEAKTTTLTPILASTDDSSSSVDIARAPDPDQARHLHLHLGFVLALGFLTITSISISCFFCLVHKQLVLVTINSIMDSCCNGGRGDDPMDVDIKEELMPFPHVVDGKMETWLLDINKQDKMTLRDWCCGFGLHYSGNKKALKNELCTFSRNQAAWDCILPGARRTHRGPRIGSKRTSKKSSASLAESHFPGQ
ncbi:hypothetical protein BYT27DRAFT_7256938 [Phlegmacium glaucopus]|nr:hypothetical protein BYT27DRAFT_7256938 [Phlegmacium glaucopus]